MDSGSENAHELQRNVNQPLVESPTLSWKQRLVFAAIASIFAGYIGFCLTVFIPAMYIDRQANIQHPGAGAGATLAAMFFMLVGLVIGPIVGAIGGLIGGLLGKWLFDRPFPPLIFILLGGLLAGIITAGIDMHKMSFIF